MNEVRMLPIVMRRLFSRKAAKPTRSRKPEMSSELKEPSLAGIRGKLRLIEEEDMEIFDAEDMSEFESDFMNVSESHRMHEREMWQNKERLKQQITAQKYFKEKEPRFLTFAETNLIRKLHETDPEEWTIERLSESFPALPETVQKILKAKWAPKSVDRVIQYDNAVVDNWKKFQTGKLPVSPMLGKHLAKFKNRKIILTDRESLAKQFVTPKPEFAKPKSQLFSNIVQSCLNERQSDERLLPQGDNSNGASTTPEHSHQTHDSSSINIKSDESSFAVEDSEEFTSSKNRNLALLSQADSKKYDLTLSNRKKETKHDDALPFNEFVKAKLEDIYKECPQEGMVLLDVYKKQLRAATDAAEVSAEETTESKLVRKSDKSERAVSKRESKALDFTSTKEDAVDTYVKAWNKKADTQLEYAKPIKIAKHLHKPGMTYRINDCYYDDDGEFLYRVPGVRS
ncbi:uncharacterized protein LOC105287565 [Ooceraea biroi]|uniref:Neugrin n=1 Tax=Ooceraea biroi TaxID=2015173 RepID=A0A026WZ69_OOCBI|nr:uncharacterized protein LOC105287565 [Ooceraea biroi]EZA61041.1 Neugrin [Ooceraea biroi]